MKSELFPGIGDVNFAEKDPDIITKELVGLYEQITGHVLARADPVRLFIDAIILAVVQQRNIIDYAAKMNLLAYAEGDYLDHIGALLGVTRLAASSATCTMTFTLARTLGYNAVIPAGTRVSAGTVTFATTERLTIPAGELSGNVDAVALTPGIEANGLALGQVSRIDDPLTFEVRAENITQTNGGSEIESDEAFRERIQIAPESFTVAGPVKAYEYFARSADPNIIDVSVVGPPTTQPGHVDIYPLMTGGTLPNDDVLAQVYAACNASDVRPDTDYVSVLRPVSVNYNLALTYYIDEANSSGAGIICANCEQAVSDWILWQRQALGRDINPSELVKRVMNAGAKRCVISSPSFTTLTESQIAVCSSRNVSYGGLEKA